MPCPIHTQLVLLPHLSLLTLPTDVSMPGLDKIEPQLRMGQLYIPHNVQSG